MSEYWGLITRATLQTILVYWWSRKRAGYTHTFVARNSTQKLNSSDPDDSFIFLLFFLSSFFLLPFLSILLFLGRVLNSVLRRASIIEDLCLVAHEKAIIQSSQSPLSTAIVVIVLLFLLLLFTCTLPIFCLCISFNTWKRTKTKKKENDSRMVFSQIRYMHYACCSYDVY